MITPIDLNASLYEHYTRHRNADVGKPDRGIATRVSREMLCSIMPADEWVAIEAAALSPWESSQAEEWRQRAGYILDAPDILL